MRTSNCYVNAAVLLFLALFTSSNGVDHGNFKTCDDSGFCKRNRAMHPNPKSSPFQLLTGSAKVVNTTTVEVEMAHAHSGVSYTVTLTGLADCTLRFVMDETNSPVKRYVPKEALVEDLGLTPLNLISKSQSNMEVTYCGKNSNRHKAVLHAKPFKLDLYLDGELVISTNSAGLMRFEHYRQRQQNNPPEPEANNDGDDDDGTEEQDVAYNERGEKIVGSKASSYVKQEKKRNSVPSESSADAEMEGAWEETFKGHVDSKPRGPMSVGLDFTFEGFEHVYGLAEHADSFSLKPTKGQSDPYRLYNLDVFEYEVPSTMALYGAAPYMVAHNSERTVGLLWLNAAETWVDIEVPKQDVLSSVVDFVKRSNPPTRRETHWFSETGRIDVFFLAGPRPKDVSRQLAKIVGSTPLPPLFSLGYHQCRWNYNDEEDVHVVDTGFDTYDIPYDVLWLDIEHTDGKRYFTWDPVKFPNPEKMAMNLTSKGRKLVTIVDPHIKRDDNYFLHKEAKDLGLYVKNKDGTDFNGWCWSGSSSYIDFLNPTARAFWALKFHLDQYKGSSLDVFTWNDMNEPSVFNGPEVTCQKDVKHNGDYENRDIHNIYGMLMTMATYNGHLVRSDHKLRPFILSRSFFLGSQRYVAVWTGDNMANWESMRIVNPMLLSLSVCGVSFVGADVGGFFGDPETELLVRWYQMGAFHPFFRGHAHHDTKRREPWLFDPETVSIIRSVIRMRYSHLPIWYTLFYENEKTGIPPMRPLFYEFPEDKSIFATDDTFMVGSSLLVSPVMYPGEKQHSVYLPGPNEVWYNLFDRRRMEGGQTYTLAVDIRSIPVYQRGGTILPTKERVRRSSSQMFTSATGASDPYTLTVALDKDRRSANGILYVDDGATFSYRKGEYLLIEFQYKDGILSSKVAEGNLKTGAWIERINILGLDKLPVSVKAKGQSSSEEKLAFSEGSNGMLVIRKPSFNVANQWQLKLNL